MISDPFKYAIEFVKAGADILTFHYEACDTDAQVFKIIDMIHEAGAKASISVKPNTPVEKIFPFLTSLDMVLIMSVEPGFGGQKFMEDCAKKISEIKKIDKEVLVEVDGGINKETAQICRMQGVDVLVAGSYIFNAKNRIDAIDSLK
jgi:ribulose-phosphate 3-epimerase